MATAGSTRITRRPNRGHASYYAELWDWVKVPRNLGAIIHYYQVEREEISTSFNPLTPPPASKTKAALIEASKSNLQQYLEAAWADQRAPFKYPLVTLDDILQHFDLHATAFRGVGLHELGNVVQRVGGVKLGQIHLPNGERRRLWAVGPSADAWVDRPLAVLRMQYQQQRGKKMMKAHVETGRIRAIRAVRAQK